jgi:hypothetical protein
MLPISLAAVVVLVLVGLAAVLLLLRTRKLRRTGPRRGPGWKPKVQHEELPTPAPSQDPAIAWFPPSPDEFRTQRPPLSDYPLDATARGQLDGYALGRAKQILEAPSLLQHAAADAETWPGVEATVREALALAESRGVLFKASGKQGLMQALALCAAQGTLLAEWRQLEDGKTSWQGEGAVIRASDLFTLNRLADAMRPKLLPDLFAGIERRARDFEVAVLVPHCIAQAFYRRLHGDPPHAFQAA